MHITTTRHSSDPGAAPERGRSPASPRSETSLGLPGRLYAGALATLGCYTAVAAVFRDEPTCGPRGASAPDRAATAAMASRSRAQ